MTKLTNTNTRATAVAAPAVAPRPQAARPVVASVRLIGKTVLFAIEVVEIVGFGLALL